MNNDGKVETDNGFTGFFIPIEWINDKRLIPTDWLILAEIRALCSSKNSKMPGWCYATNQHIAKFVAHRGAWISERCGYLQKIGLLEQKFNGRIMLRRITRVCLETDPDAVQRQKQTPSGNMDCPCPKTDQSNKGEKRKKETKTDYTADAKHRRHIVRVDYTDEFENIVWQKCPKGSKSRALELWQEIPRDQIQHVYNRLCESVAACKSNNRQHRDLVKWLEERGWEDEYKNYEPINNC